MNLDNFQILKSQQENITCTFSERPSSCVVTLYKPNGSVLTAQGSATLGITGSISSSCGYSQNDRRTINLTSGSYYSSLKIGKTYRLKNTSSQFEFVEANKLPTNNYQVEVNQELRFDYEANDTIEDCTVSRAITTTEAATVDLNYRARFVATFSDSSTQTKDILFDVVEHQIFQPITTENLQEFDPVIQRQLPVEDQAEGFEDQLNIAFQMVKQDLIYNQLFPHRIINDRQLAILHLYKFKQILTENGISLLNGSYPQQDIKNWQWQYKQALEHLMQSMTWYDDDEDLLPEPDETSETKRSPSFKLG